MSADASNAAHAADEREVGELILRYADCIDRRDWSGWGSVFAEDAVADYATWGQEELLGSRSGRAELVDFMRASMAPWPVTHHLIGNVRVELDGDAARLRSYVQATHVTPGAAEHFQAGGWYEIAAVRAAGGWCIRHLRLEIVWTMGGSPNVADG